MITRRATAAALAACSLLAACCAAACGTAGHGPAARTGLGQVSTGVTGQYIPATMAQVADGTTFQLTITTLQKELFEHCIRSYGFGPRAQAVAFRNLNLMPFEAISGYTQNQNAAVGLVDLSSVTRTGMLAPIYIPEGRPDTTGISAAEQEALRADQWHCWDKTLVPVRKLQRQGFALQRQWYAQEVRLLGTRQVRQATNVFGRCITRAGAPRTASESLGQFLAWLQGMVNRGVYSVPAGGSGPAVQPRQQVDAHWSGVFLRCGRPLVTLLQRLLPGIQQGFLQLHFGQVAALEKTARQTVAALERMTESQF